MSFTNIVQHVSLLDMPDTTGQLLLPDYPDCWLWFFAVSGVAMVVCAICGMNLLTSDQ